MSDLRVVKKTVAVPSWSRLEKEYDPSLHPVITDPNYTDKFRGSSTERMTRITLGWMKLAVKRMTELMFGIDVLRVYDDHGEESQKRAAELSRDIREYLREPHKLFRRVRNEKGQLRLSKAAAACHPGRGVYRSSYRNALRLTATENNMAYRTADHDRWQRLDFVIGMEVRTSGNHPVEDVCDELAGVYPKTFKFVGWHPFCRCFAVPKLADEDEFIARQQALIDGTALPAGPYAGEVTEMPESFDKWVEANAGRIEKAKSLPYFITDNRAAVDSALHPAEKKELRPVADIAAERHAKRTPAQIEDMKRRYWMRWEPDCLTEAQKNANIDAYLQLEKDLGIKRGWPMTFEEANELRGNPNYRKGAKFRSNCSPSSFANELRRRGFDVEAYGNTKQDWFMPTLVARRPEIAFAGPAGEPPLPRSVNFTGNLLADLKNEMKAPGRYHLRFRFDNDGGHIITAERLADGTLRVYDPQNGKLIKNFSEYASKVNPSSFEYYRVDDLEINVKVARGVVKARGAKGDAPRMSLPEITEGLNKGWFGDIKTDVAEYVKARNAAETFREKVVFDFDIIKNGKFIRSEYYSTAKGSIFATEELPMKITKENLELAKNIQMAKKMVDNGFDVYLLSNPQATHSADFIFVKKGKVYYTEGKLSTGKSSLDHNLAKGSQQAERILIDVTGADNTNYISSQLKIAFEGNENLKDIMLLKGKRLIWINSLTAKRKDFHFYFKKLWEKKK